MGLGRYLEVVSAIPQGEQHITQASFQSNLKQKLKK
jgi:hypothetical protein